MFLKKFFIPTLHFLFSVFLLALLAVAGLFFYLAPEIPSIDVLRDISLQEPMRVYAQDGKLIAEYGQKHRTPINYAEVPDLFIKAFLAAEDDRFFDHPGVDYQGLLRAAFQLALTGERRQGGSTITMQVARNFFLSREKTFRRKLVEILLALRIEEVFSKQEIFQLYVNKIFFGHRAYGIRAAAQVYYGKAVAELTVAQMAMLAGVPKAPSLFNPITNAQRAVERRNYVLGRMRHLGFIDEAVYQKALTEPDVAWLHGVPIETKAPYVGEMVRAELLKRFGDTAYAGGYRVTTTLDSRLQEAANRALRKALLEYDQRHGYRGPEAHVDLDAGSSETLWQHHLQDFQSVNGLDPGLVVKVTDQSAWVYRGHPQVVEITLENMHWAARYINANRRGRTPRKATEVVKVGDIVRIRQAADGAWQLAQLPTLEGALVSLDPQDGAVKALVGGFDFNRAEFNRAVYAKRQPGSSFKPFIYSAALEKGFTLASLVNDVPIAIVDGSNKLWTPKNYKRQYHGPTRIREALTFSRNLASIDLLRRITVDYAISYTRLFGFSDETLPRGLSLALGSGVISPLDLAAGYAVFANGGYRIEPYFIQRIEDTHGRLLFEASPAVACRDCATGFTEVENKAENAVEEPDVVESVRSRQATRIISPQNVYLIDSMLQDVIRRGTGRRAARLGRGDLAGKTGTTNDQRDAWFCGFNQELVATTWVGFDQMKPLGRHETGGRAALPMWMAFMGEALKDRPEIPFQQPSGLVVARINKYTGGQTDADDPDSIFETFREGFIPTATAHAGDFYDPFYSGQKPLSPGAMLGESELF